MIGFGLASVAAAATLAEAQQAFEEKQYFTASDDLVELLPELEGAERAEAQLLLARTFEAIAFEDVAVVVLLDAARSAPDDAARAPFLDRLVELRAEDLGDLLAGATGQLPRAEAALLEARRLAASGAPDEALTILGPAVSVTATCPEASRLEGALLAARGDPPEAAWTRECPKQHTLRTDEVAAYYRHERKAELLAHRAGQGDVEVAEELAKERARLPFHTQAELGVALARWKAGDARALSRARKAAARAEHWVPDAHVLVAEIAAARCVSSPDERIAAARASLAVPDDDPAVRARLTLDPEVFDLEQRLDLVEMTGRIVALGGEAWGSGPAGRLASDALQARRGALEELHDAALDRARGELAQLRDDLDARLDAAEQAAATCR